MMHNTTFKMEPSHFSNGARELAPEVSWEEFSNLPSRWGDVSNGVVFQVAKTLALSNKLPEGDGVRVLFTDFGAKSLVATRWTPLPENLVLDHLPPVLPKRELRMEERKIAEILAIGDLFYHFF